MTIPVNQTRRRLLAGASAAGGLALVARPALGTPVPDELAAAVAAFAQGAPLREGKVTLEVAELVDNGNAVPLTVAVASAMTAAEHVTAIAVFNERNPQRDVATFRLGPRSGRARISTRIRLATSQRLVAVARMNDGSCWTKTVDVIVTLAACIEGEG